MVPKCCGPVCMLRANGANENTLFFFRMVYSFFVSVQEEGTLSCSTCDHGRHTVKIHQGHMMDCKCVMQPRCSPYLLFYS